MKLNAILVPLDGSALAEAALPEAIELAQSSGARLTLLRAAEAHTLPGADQTNAQIQVVAEAEEYLDRTAEHLRTLGLEVKTSVWYGPPAYSIIEAVSLYKIDLIVMSSHGRTGLGRLILGSVAESVLRGTTVPILLIRPAEAPVEPPWGRDQARPWPVSEHV